MPPVETAAEPTLAERFCKDTNPMAYEDPYRAFQVFTEDAACQLVFPDNSIACSAKGKVWLPRSLTYAEVNTAMGRTTLR